MKGSPNTGNCGTDSMLLQVKQKKSTLHGSCSRFRMRVWEFTVSFSYVMKRLLDLMVSSAVLLLGFPFFLLLAILVKLSSHGPSLFVQTRVGYMGRHFLFYKFRSMVVNKPRQVVLYDLVDMEDVKDVKVTILDTPSGVQPDEAVLRKLKEYACVVRAKPNMTIRTKVAPKDPNITLLGRFLRKTSLDELPQFFNVLLGEMSLVGPRPPVPSEVRKYSLDDRKRLNVKPGLTCLWQIKGRSNLSFEKQLQLDKEYIQSQSFFQDFLILLKTVPAIIIGRGAY